MSLFLPEAPLSQDDLTFRDLQIEGYEKVIEVICEKADLHAIIAIHNSSLGPALGGIRAFPYPTFEAALTDALRLAKGMTYKSALSGTGTGGGKSVIITKPNQTKSHELLLAFAAAVNALNGEYICAEDVGMSVDDLAILRNGTKFAVGLPHPKSSGDPSYYTARGGFRGIEAVAQALFGSRSLKGKRVAIQGLGSVGMKLAALLFWEGAELIVTDISDERVKQAYTSFGADCVSPDKIFEVECDIFAPCAMGGILNEKTIPRLKCKAIAGVANNQLHTDLDGHALHKRGILYAPDYAINSGGLLNVATEIEENGYNPKIARDKVDTIFDLMLKIFAHAKEKNIPTSQAANELAEYKLKHGIGKRARGVFFHH